MAAADLKYKVEAAKRQAAAKAKELKDVKARSDALQGGKEKTEAELLQSIKQRRESQLAWNEQRAALDKKVQVCGWHLVAMALNCTCHPHEHGFVYTSELGIQRSAGGATQSHVTMPKCVLEAQIAFCGLQWAMPSVCMNNTIVDVATARSCTCLSAGG